jgi:predicted RNA-binding Zn ribbon-like protein
MAQIQTANADSAKFLAGALSLDFVNTKSGRATPEERERLVTYDDLLAWSLRAGVIEEARAGRLAERAAKKPAKALRAVERAYDLREAMHAIFAALARKQQPEPRALDVLNDSLQRAAKRGGLAPAPEGNFAWRWEEDALESPLWAIAHAAASVLTGAELGRLRACGGHGCGWLFIDRSRNGTRRWCEMEVCGNRAKARRHHAKKRAAEGAR